MCNPGKPTYCWWFRNPANQLMQSISQQFIRFYTSQAVEDFFHQHGCLEEGIPFGKKHFQDPFCFSSGRYQHLPHAFSGKLPKTGLLFGFECPTIWPQGSQIHRSLITRRDLNTVMYCIAFSTSRTHKGRQPFYKKHVIFSPFFGKFTIRTHTGKATKIPHKTPTTHRTLPTTNINPWQKAIPKGNHIFQLWVWLNQLALENEFQKTQCL